MWFVDGHLDLAYLAVNGRNVIERHATAERGCVSLPSLRLGGVRLALATIFTELGADPARDAAGYRSSDDRRGAEVAAQRQLVFYERLEQAGEIRFVRVAEDLDGIETDRDGPLRIVILMEGCDPIERPEAARRWFDRGVRVFGLSWARGSRYAGGNAAPAPLTSEGRELVEALEALGAIHDLSHLSDEGADELLERTAGMVVASHSNARAVLGEGQRHLSDRHYEAVAARGGVVGLNLFGRFLHRDQGRRATIDDCLRHLDHARKVAGSGTVALGSDMDGGFPPEELPEGLDRPERVPVLAGMLRAAGWPDRDIAAFAHGNWLRVLRRSLPRSAG